MLPFRLHPLAPPASRSPLGASPSASADVGASAPRHRQPRAHARTRSASPRPRRRRRETSSLRSSPPTRARTEPLCARRRAGGSRAGRALGQGSEGALPGRLLPCRARWRPRSRIVFRFRNGSTPALRVHILAARGADPGCGPSASWSPRALPRASGMLDAPEPPQRPGPPGDLLVVEFTSSVGGSSRRPGSGTSAVTRANPPRSSSQIITPARSQAQVEVPPPRPAPRSQPPRSRSS